MHDIVSWSSHYTLEDHCQPPRNPYVSIKIHEGLRLENILETDELLPYIRIHQAEN